MSVVVMVMMTVMTVMAVMVAVVTVVAVLRRLLCAIRSYLIGGLICYVLIVIQVLHKTSLSVVLLFSQALQGIRSCF